MTLAQPIPRAAARRGAFTLVELLATLTLACIVLPVAVQGVLLALETAEHARQQAEAAALAQTKMAELVAAGEWYDAAVEGDFGDQWPDYRWEAQVGDWEDPRVQQLDVWVTWTRRGRERYVALSTLIYTGTATND